MQCHPTNYYRYFVEFQSITMNQQRVNYILPPKHDRNNHDDDHHSYTNTNRNQLPVIAAWHSCSRCRWRGRRDRLEEDFYIRDVCPNSCLKRGLVSYNDVRQCTARQDREISDEESKGLLHVKRYLERAGWVARVTRQQVNLVSGVEVRKRGTSDDNMEWKNTRISKRVNSNYCSLIYFLTLNRP